MWRGRSRWIAALVGVSTLCAEMALPPLATAQSRFQIPEECGTEARFHGELERLIGSAAAEALPSELVITREPGGAYKLRLRLGAEARELEDSDCRALLDGAVVIAAAAWRGHLPTAPPADGPSPAAEAAATPPPPVRAPPPRARPSGPEAPRSGPLPAAPSEEPTQDFRFGLGFGAGISGGVQPDVGAVLELGASVEPRPWGASLALRHWPESTATRSGRDVAVTALGGRAAGLIRLGASARLAFGIEVNRLSGTGGEAVSGRESDAAWHIAPALGLDALAWNVGHLRVELSVVGRIALVRPRFVVTGFGNVYEVPPFGSDAILRGVWLFR